MGGGDCHFGYFNLDKNSKDKNSTLNPWAFIRVKNEAITLEKSLYSILPAIQRGIIAYNDRSDKSEEIIPKLCDTFKTFKAYKYSYEVQALNPKSKENTVYEYYNFALFFHT